MSIWLISDTHFGHELLVNKGFRKKGFEKVVLKNLSRLSKNDILIHLGDICLGFDQLNHDTYIKPLQCKKWLVRGNHDHKCLSKKTRLLTLSGYKYYNELSCGDIIPTVNLKTGKVEYNPINDIYIYKNVEELYVASSRSGRMELTNHHVVINQLGTTGSSDYWKKQLAENLWGSKTQFRVPVCFSSCSKYKISDDNLKLIAWIMTDGSILSSNKLLIYQSKKNYVIEIENLLNRLNIKFSKKIKNRKIKYICGKVIKSSLPQCVISLDINQSRLFLKEVGLSNKYKIPEILWNLSDKQFDTFLIELIKGDGTFKKEKENGTLVLWGKYDILMQIMGLCVTHNRHANICKQTNTSNYYLTIRKNNSGKQFDSSKLTIEKYNDIVWCVNVNNNVIFVELNGKSFVTGNSNTWYLNNGWDFVCHKFSNRYFGKNILFSHRPSSITSKTDLNIHGHFHNSDFRRREPELLARLTDRHRLFSLEDEKYQVVLLDSFINKKYDFSKEISKLLD
jgi:calcineurin-like phosphoesterase family protein